MAVSFLDYLTLPNPTPDSSRCKDGTNHKTSGSYGPDEVKPWMDLSMENLEMTYKDILMHPMRKPRVRSADDIEPEMARLFEEASVQSLAEHWNEKVVQHVIDGTQKLLHDKLPDGPFDCGKIYFVKNKGQGHLKDGDGNVSKPDWCLYQKTEAAEKEDYYGNLLPGDIKTAKKWKADWINSSNLRQRKKADPVLAQITKYMCLADTRYGFVLSEEELVAMRISRYERDIETLEELAQDDTAGRAQVLDSTNNLEDDPDGAFADTERRVGILLEFCKIPWTANGMDSLTINLALWWLSVLAAQCPPIKEAGKYTSMGAKSPENSTNPADVEPQTNAEQQDRSSIRASSSKRKAKVSVPITNGSRRTRSSEMAQTRIVTGEKRAMFAETSGPGQSFTSDASSRASKRRRRAPATYEEPVSDTELTSSQATDNYDLSFYAR
ncbi:hypothetical protein Daus18300_011242 [Diaporthe australafricana]|uniref:Uncharacterized protein n=1 Tax=Diaporthe australafricana TaxID=127596 RepID=A0ABR3W7C3_9PEZI